MIQDKACSEKSIIIVALVTAACLAGDSMLYIVLPTHWQEAGLDSLWEVGILLSINRFIRLPITPLVGWAYTHISVRTGVLAAVLMGGVLTLGYGMVHNFMAWFVLRCLWGLSWTFLRMGAYLMILECADVSGRGALFGRYNGLFRLGSLVGMLVGGFVADVWNLSTAALLFGATAIAATPFIPGHVPNVLVAARDSTSVFQRLSAAADPMVRKALLTGMVIALAFQGVVASSLSHLVRTNFGTTVSFWTFAVGAASLAGLMQAARWSWEPWLAPWFGRLSDGHMSRKRVLSMALFAGALLMSALPFKLSIGFWICLVVGMQVTATALTTVGDAAAADVAAQHSRATIMTLYVMATDIGAALGPFLGYFIAEMWGTGSMYWSAAVLLAVVAAWWEFGKRS